MGRADSSLRSSSTVQPRCYCSRADRDGDRGETERGGGEGQGRMGHRERDTCMHCTYAKKSGPFPRSSDRSYALPPRARLFSFNRLPIFPRSIPPRGDLKGHCGSARLITRFIIPIIYLSTRPDRFHARISLNATDVVLAEILALSPTRVIIAVEVSERKKTCETWLYLGILARGQ